jgi:hypothetical protein
VYKPKLPLQVHHLISELNDITAAEEGPVLPDGAWREKLSDNSGGLFNSFPRAIQEMLLLERDPHGNVQVRGAAGFCVRSFWGFVYQKRVSNSRESRWSEHGRFLGGCEPLKC